MVWDIDTAMPFMFLADDAFPLSENIMKPYPQRNLDELKHIVAFLYLIFEELVKTHLEFLHADFAYF